jgi:Tol biopolymer transport system component
VFGLDPACEGDTSLLPGQPLVPQFTPDGSSLVYAGGTNRHPVIWIVPVVGGESTLYLRDAKNVSLSPDGSLVTFLDNPAGGLGQHRWVADADGTNRRLLPEVYGIPCLSTVTGTWSTDGSRIVCSEASKVIVTDIATGAATPDIATGAVTPVAWGRGAIWLDDHTLLVSV